MINLLLLISLPIILCSNCDMTKCGSETKIVPFVLENNPIAIEKTPVSLCQYPESENVLYTSRRRFKAYCYQGSVLDPNTGCETSEHDFPIPKDKARRYVIDDRCETGCECSAVSCTGSDSDCCLSNSFTNTKGPETMGSRTYQTASLGRHSCTSRWSCVARKVEIRPTLNLINGAIQRFVTVYNKHLIEMDREFYSNGIKISDSSFYYSEYDEAPQPVCSSAEAKCYSSSLDNIDCVTNVKGKKIPFKINPIFFKGVVRNMVMVIMGKIKTVEDGRIISVSPSQNSISTNPTLQKFDDQERAASISSLNEIINGIKITQMQEISNSMNNHNEINVIKNHMASLISFLSKKYPLLLSNVLGENFKTKWLTEEVFQICPCLPKTDIFKETNCVGDLVYKEGEVIRKTSNDHYCVSFDERRIKNTTIFEKTAYLDVTELDYLPPKAASSDDSTWDWLVHKNTDVRDYNEDKIDYNAIRDFVSSLNPFFSLKDLVLYFSFIICCLYLIDKLLNRVR